MIEIHARRSLRSVAVRGAAVSVARPFLRYYPVRGPIAPLRHALDLGARSVPRHRGTQVAKVAGEGWTAELVSPRGVRAGKGAMLYFHGGAFVFCGVATHRRVVERLALRTGRPVLSVAYRQHGRGHVDSSVSDCVDATNWMINHGFDPAALVLAGDSAGGYLSFQVALEAASQGIHLAGVVGLSPWLEFDNTERRNHVNARRDAYIPTYRLDRIARTVTGKPILEPALSPVNRDLAQLPPALIVCAADEILRYDAELMTERLEKAGVPVQLHIWEGQVHAFPVLAELMPESSAALDDVAGFVTGLLDAKPGRRRLRSVSDLAG